MHGLMTKRENLSCNRNETAKLGTRHTRSSTRSESMRNSTQGRTQERPYPVRLLLVDDNAVFAEATAEFLKIGGLDVRVAENGKDALETAEAFRPQIVLCDLML